MILAFLIALFIVFLVIRRIRRSRRLFDIQTRPYRYPMEARRSNWANRGGF